MSKVVIRAMAIMAENMAMTILILVADKISNTLDVM
jgi:hypothetical protein